MDRPRTKLLAADEPSAVLLEKGDEGSSFLFVCDHASRRLPRALGNLGLAEDELLRHIAWDIGALEVARRLRENFSAPLVAQNYSRLVIDCNRPHHVGSSVPHLSEETVIPGNQDLSPMDLAARREEIFEPYHAEISALLDAREAAGHESILISVHSFTPVFKQVERPWHIGLLYNRDDRLAGPMHDELTSFSDLVIGDNVPYRVSDETDYTIPVHGEARGIHHIMIEIRQDLITEESGQEEWAGRLTQVLEGITARIEK